MIDFHNHVLPGADDGSKSLEMSLNMLRNAAEQGVTDVVNTIHYQHPKMNDMAITLADLENRINDLQEEVDRANIPIRLHRGAEVFYLPNLLELVTNPVATMGNGKYMLVEFQMHQLPENYRDVLFKLVMRGVTPIIAHPERYKPVQNDLSILYDLINAGCIMQMDAGSLISSLGKSAQKAAEEILKKGLYQIIGSDAHDDRNRNFCLVEAVEIGRSIVGNVIDKLVTENPLKVIQGNLLEPEIAYIPEQKAGIITRLKNRLWSV